MIVDADLATPCGVETRVLMQAVKRTFINARGLAATQHDMVKRLSVSEETTERPIGFVTPEEGKKDKPAGKKR